MGYVYAESTVRTRYGKRLLGSIDSTAWPMLRKTSPKQNFEKSANREQNARANLEAKHVADISSRQARQRNQMPHVFSP
jgi:hypothetical protein